MEKELSLKIRMISFVMITMVLYIHAYNITPEIMNSQPVASFSFNVFLQCLISQGYARVAVPIFFAISGFLYFQNITVSPLWFCSKLKNRFTSLVVPYIAWSLLGIGLYAVLQSFSSLNRFFTRQIIADYNPWQFIKTLIFAPIPYQLWFIRDLFVYSVLSPFIYIIIKKGGWFVLLLFGCYWIFYDKSFYVSFEGLFYFMLGSALAIKRVDIKRQCRFASLIMISWIAAQIGLTFLWLRMHFAPRPLFCSIILLGFFASWLSFDKILRLLAAGPAFKLSSFTFFIYAGHEPLLTMIKKLGFSIFGLDGTASGVIFFISPLLTMSILVCIGYLAKRYVMFLYNLLVGWRQS